MAGSNRSEPETPLGEGTITESSGRTLRVDQNITVRELAEKLEVKVTDLMGELIKIGVMAAINDLIDFKTAADASAKFDVELRPTAAAAQSSSGTKPAGPKGTRASKRAPGQARPPVVAVMGHVDHGKTSLLDKIRGTKQVEREAGGITQHLDAYQVEYKKRLITFIDTPGHEAFSLLREHGAHLTDIALIVVAVDDGVKPQTKEAIKFASAAGVKIVVALNKIDKPGIDTNRIKQQLSDLGLTAEDWGGETVMVETSAKDGTGIDKLQEMLLLIADVEKLNAPVDVSAEGTVIETRVSPGQGGLATLLVEIGTLKSSDYVVSATAYGKVRRLEDVNGKKIETAGPSTPVVVAGWKTLPQLGQRFQVAADEKTARNLSQSHAATATVATHSSTQDSGIPQAVGRTGSKQLPLIIKADVHGSLEAVINGLGQLDQEEVRLKIISHGLGNISESDISLAESTAGRVIGFNVAMPVEVKQLALRKKVAVKIYKVIYELLDDVGAEAAKLIEPKLVEQKTGTLEIKGIFKVTKGNLICGGLVTEGKIAREQISRKAGSEADLGKVVNVQKQQQDAKEVTEGELCGLNIATKAKASVQEGDFLEFFKLVTLAKD